MKAENLWDIYCRVIDNYGDVGVCWRLAAGLAARGAQVRLWLDDASALTWMAPAGAPGVTVKDWREAGQIGVLPVGDVLIEAFGCEVDSDVLAAYAREAETTGRACVWINLEYLSAESYVERCHGLPSPVQAGAGAGLRKHFYYPGFTAATGGLLREPDLLQRQSEFDRKAWLSDMNIPDQGERLISLFCYEPAALDALLGQLAAGPQATRLLITAGRAAAACHQGIADRDQRQTGWNSAGKLRFSSLPTLTQTGYDCLLWSCDVNFVRGEDSLVRAIWAKKPFIWQIYPQTDDAHRTKLEAFLDLLRAPPSLRAFHRAWNALEAQTLPALAGAEWQETATDMRSRLLDEDDLVTQIIQFAQKKR